MWVIILALNIKIWFFLPAKDLYCRVIYIPETPHSRSHPLWKELPIQLPHPSRFSSARRFQSFTSSLPYCWTPLSQSHHDHRRLCQSLTSQYLTALVHHRHHHLERKIFEPLFLNPSTKRESFSSHDAFLVNVRRVDYFILDVKICFNSEITPGKLANNLVSI